MAPGGDQTQAELVLAEPVLKQYTALVRLPFLDVPDPRAAVLKQFTALARLPFLDVPDPRAAVLKKAAADLCAVRIRVTDPPS